MSFITNQFDSNLEGNFEIQLYINQSCENQDSVVQNWRNTNIETPLIANPNSGPPSSSTPMNLDLESTENTISFKFFNQSNITHAIHYEIYKKSAETIFPTIDSPHVIVNPKQFSGIITIENLDSDTEYRVQMRSFFFEEPYGSGFVEIETESGVANPDSSTINQNLVTWRRKKIQAEDLFKINVHSAYFDPPFSSPNEDNYCGTYYFQEKITSTIENIVNFILNTGWLKSSTNEGWKVTGDSLDKVITLSLNNSNTYNALISIAETHNLEIYFDYSSETVIFKNQINSDLDQNFTLKRDFNLENYQINYNAENLYSIYNVQGATDINNSIITLSQETPYQDNFLFNFDYFDSVNLLSKTIESSKINQNLKIINQTLNELSQEKNTLITEISDTKARIKGFVSSIVSGEDEGIIRSNYNSLINEFKRIEDIPEKVFNKKAITPEFIENWVNLEENYEVDLNFPVKVGYWESEISENFYDFIFNNNEEVWNPTGEWNMSISLENSENAIEYIHPKGQKIYLQIDNPQNFNPVLFFVVSSKIQYSLNITFDDRETIFPYFDKLYSYNGITEILKEREEIQKNIDFAIEEFDKAYKYNECIKLLKFEGSLIKDIDINLLNSNDLTDEPGSEWEAESCDIFSAPEFALTVKGIIDGYENKISEYKTFIGEYNPELKILDSNRPGIYNYLIQIFDDYYSEYTPIPKEPVLKRWERQINLKKDFWFNLKRNRQHLFLEGFLDIGFAANAEELKEEAELIFTDHQKPKEEISVSYIDISNILGKNIKNILVGDYVYLKEDYHKDLLLNTTKLKVAGINKNLRNNSNISLNIFRYNIYNKIIERIVANSQ